MLTGFVGIKFIDKLNIAQTFICSPQANVISYFSSFDPDVTYEGQNVGDADHDCARVLNERRSIFTDIGSEKNFRCDPEIDGNFATGNCEPTYWACSGGYQYKMVSIFA